MRGVGLACQPRRGLPCILVTGSVDSVSIERAFGAAVRSAREARGWSQAELADRLVRDVGLSVGGQSGMARVEQGVRPTRLNEVASIARYLGIDLSRLLSAGDTVFSSNDPSEEEIHRAIREHKYLLKTIEQLDLRIENAKANIARLSLQLEDAQREQRAVNERLRAIVFAIHRVYPAYRNAEHDRIVGVKDLTEEELRAIQKFEEAVDAWPPEFSGFPAAGRMPDDGDR